MTPVTVERIDKFYEKFPNMYPNIVRDEVGTRHVFIHRLDPSQKIGKPFHIIRHLNGRRDGCSWGDPVLEDWLINDYHPHIKLEVVRCTMTRIEVIGHLEMFKSPIDHCPATFVDPECSMAEVYNYAAAFTYDMLYGNKGPYLRTIDTKINSVTSGKVRMSITELETELNIIIDRKLTSQYRSIPNSAQQLASYIKQKI